jgi:hypothetical protein
VGEDPLVVRQRAVHRELPLGDGAGLGHVVVHRHREAGDDPRRRPTRGLGGGSDARGDVRGDGGGVGHPEDRAVRVLSRDAQQARAERRDQDRDGEPLGQRGGLHVDAEVLAGEGHGLAPQDRADDLHVLLGVAAGVGVVEALHQLDHRLVRRTDAQGQPGTAHGHRRSRRPGSLQRGMAGVGLEHGCAELDGGRAVAGDGHGDEGIAEHRAGEPEAREPVVLRSLGLVDDAVDGGAAAGQPDAHAQDHGTVAPCLTTSSPTTR